MKAVRSLSAGFCCLVAGAFLFAPPAWAQKASRDPCCLSGLEIVADPSVELLVTGPNGLQTGFDPAANRDVRQIPTSNYYAESTGDDSGGTASTPEVRKIEIGMPVAGRYMVQAIEQSPDKFSLEITAIDRKGNSSQRDFAGSASPGGTFVYQVEYSPAPGSPLSIVQLAPIPSLVAAVTVASGPPPLLPARRLFHPECCGRRLRSVRRAPLPPTG